MGGDGDSWPQAGSAGQVASSQAEVAAGDMAPAVLTPASVTAPRSCTPSPAPLRGAQAELPNHPQRLLLPSPAPLLSSPAPAADKLIKYIITTFQLTHCPQESPWSPRWTLRSPEQPPSPQGMQVLLLHHPKTRLDPPQGPRGWVIPGGQAGTAASPSPWGALPDRAKRSKEPSSTLPAQNLILH